MKGIQDRAAAYSKRIETLEQKYSRKPRDTQVLIDYRLWWSALDSLSDMTYNACSGDITLSSDCKEGAYSFQCFADEFGNCYFQIAFTQIQTPETFYVKFWLKIYNWTGILGRTWGFALFNGICEVDLQLYEGSTQYRWGFRVAPYTYTYSDWLSKTTAWQSITWELKNKTHMKLYVNDTYVFTKTIATLDVSNSYLFRVWYGFYLGGRIDYPRISSNFSTDYEYVGEQD